jgi:outer membrane lipoprotein-sorting protein
MKTNKLLAAAVAVLVSASAFAQTADEIIDKHITARGGADKIKAIQSIVMDNSMSTQFGEIPMTQTIVSGKGYRQEINIMGNSMVTVIDGDKGWMIRPAMMQGTGEPEDLPAEMLSGMKGQLDPGGPLFNYKDKGNKVELVGTEKVNGKDAYHLKITGPTGNVVDQWIDTATYMNVKTRATTKMQGQDVTQEMVFSDFKDVEGVKFPYTMETENPQAGQMTMTTNKITINGKVDDSVFKKPAK